MKKYAAILNPYAGRGSVTKARSKLATLLQNEFGPMDIHLTEYSGHAREIAQSLKDSVEVIVGVGGDGTLHEIVNGMMGGKAVLGVIPMGSGNDFIKMLNLPIDTLQAVQVIKKNLRKKIDIGKIGDRYFPNGVGIGFDAWVVRESMKVKKLRGFLIYLYAVIKTIFSYKNSKVIVSVDGKEEEKDIFLIAVGNGRAMGGGFFLTPQAEIDDGLLDICFIRNLKKWEVLLHLPKAINGKHVHLKQIQMMKCDKIKIVSENGIAVHADGELLGMDLKGLEISVLPAALEVITN